MLTEVKLKNTGDKVALKRVALVHDWFYTWRGGEQVFEAIAELFPKADVYTLFADESFFKKRFPHHRLHTSFLNRLPFSKQAYRHLLPFYPWGIESLDVTNYDLVISSSHAAAKGVITHPNALHVCYCHTPMRYLWDQTFTYFKGRTSLLFLPFLSHLRKWDVTSSQRVDYFIGNSNFTRRRIHKVYRREAEVVFPFVDDRFFVKKPAEVREYFLVVSALVPYKNIAQAIEACESLDMPLKIVGDGPLMPSLKKLSKKASTTFEGYQPRESLPVFYQKASALLFPQEEDFGITPLEAMASGTPVIAYASGGALDSVVADQTGLLYEDRSVEGLKGAIQTFLERSWSYNDCQARAQLFTRPIFQKQLLQAIEKYEKQGNL